MIIKINIIRIIMRSIGTFIHFHSDLVYSDGAKPNLDKLEAHYNSPTNIIVTHHLTQSQPLKAILMNTYYSLNY